MIICYVTTENKCSSLCSSPYRLFLFWAISLLNIQLIIQIFSSSHEQQVIPRQCGSSTLCCFWEVIFPPDKGKPVGWRCGHGLSPDPIQAVTAPQPGLQDQLELPATTGLFQEDQGGGQEPNPHSLVSTMSNDGVERALSWDPVKARLSFSLDIFWLCEFGQFIYNVIDNSKAEHVSHIQMENIGSSASCCEILKHWVTALTVREKLTNIKRGKKKNSKWRKTKEGEVQKATGQNVLCIPKTLAFL